MSRTAFDFTVGGTISQNSTQLTLMREKYAGEERTTRLGMQMYEHAQLIKQAKEEEEARLIEEAKQRAAQVRQARIDHKERVARVHLARTIAMHEPIASPNLLPFSAHFARMPPPQLSAHAAQRRRGGGRGGQRTARVDHVLPGASLRMHTQQQARELLQHCQQHVHQQMEEHKQQQQQQQVQSPDGYGHDGGFDAELLSEPTHSHGHSYPSGSQTSRPPAASSHPRFSASQRFQHTFQQQQQYQQQLLQQQQPPQTSAREPARTYAPAPPPPNYGLSSTHIHDLRPMYRAGAAAGSTAAAAVPAAPAHAYSGRYRGGGHKPHGAGLTTRLSSSAYWQPTSTQQAEHADTINGDLSSSLSPTNQQRAKLEELYPADHLPQAPLEAQLEAQRTHGTLLPTQQTIVAPSGTSAQPFNINAWSIAFGAQKKRCRETRIAEHLLAKRYL